MDKKTRGRNPVKTKSLREAKSKSADSNKKKTKKHVVSKRSKSNPGKLKSKTLKGNKTPSFSNNSLPTQATEKLKSNLENIRHHSSLRFNLNSLECKNTPPTYADLKKEIRANKAFILTSPNSLEALQEEVNAYRNNLNSHVNYLQEKFGIKDYTPSGGVSGSSQLTEDVEGDGVSEHNFRTYKPTDKSDKYCTDALELSYDPLRSDVDDEYESNLRQNVSDDYLKTISERTETKSETKSDLSDRFKGNSRGMENVASRSISEARNSPKVELIEIPCPNSPYGQSYSSSLPSPKPVHKVHCNPKDCQSEIDHKCTQCSTAAIPPVLEKCVSCKISPDCDKNINTEFFTNNEMPRNMAVVATVSKIKNCPNAVDNRLTIQHMPSIQIQRELVMQKVLNLDIKPTTKPEDCQLPLCNVSYLECSHEANHEKLVACRNNCIRESLTKNLNHIEEVRKHAGKTKQNVLARIDTIAESIRGDLNMLNKSRLEDPTKEQVLIYKCIDDLSDKKLCVKGVEESQKVNVIGLDKNSVIGDDEVVKDEPEKEKHNFGLLRQDNNLKDNTHCPCEGNNNLKEFPSTIYISDGMVCHCDDSLDYRMDTHASSAIKINKDVHKDAHKDVNITFVTEIISEKNCESKKEKKRMSSLDMKNYGDDEDLILVHDVSVQVSFEDLDYMNEEYIKTYVRSSVDQSKFHQNNFDEYGKRFSDLNVESFVQEVYDPKHRKSHRIASTVRSKSILLRSNDRKNSFNPKNELRENNKNNSIQSNVDNNVVENSKLNVCDNVKEAEDDKKYLGEIENEKRKLIEDTKDDKTNFPIEVNVIQVEPNIVEINPVEIERILAPKSIKSSMSNLDQLSEIFSPKNTPIGDNTDIKSYFKPCQDKTCIKKKMARRHRKPQTITEMAATNINSGTKDDSYSEGEVKFKNDLSSGELRTKIRTILAPTIRNPSSKDTLKNGKQNIYNKNFVSYYYSRSSSPGTNNPNGAHVTYTVSK